MQHILYLMLGSHLAIFLDSIEPGKPAGQGARRKILQTPVKEREREPDRGNFATRGGYGSFP